MEWDEQGRKFLFEGQSGRIYRVWDDTYSWDKCVPYKRNRQEQYVLLSPEFLCLDLTYDTESSSYPEAWLWWRGQIVKVMLNLNVNMLLGVNFCDEKWTRPVFSAVREEMRIMYFIQPFPIFPWSTDPSFEIRWLLTYLLLLGKLMEWNKDVYFFVW